MNTILWHIAIVDIGDALSIRLATDAKTVSAWVDMEQSIVFLHLTYDPIEALSLKHLLDDLSYDSLKSIIKMRDTTTKHFLSRFQKQSEDNNFIS
jgi:hypothetical protein